MGVYVDVVLAQEIYKKVPVVEVHNEVVAEGVYEELFAVRVHEDMLAVVPTVVRCNKVQAKEITVMVVKAVVDEIVAD